MLCKELWHWDKKKANVCSCLNKRIEYHIESLMLMYSNVSIIRNLLYTHSTCQVSDLVTDTDVATNSKPLCVRLGNEWHCWLQTEYKLMSFNSCHSSLRLKSKWNRCRRMRTYILIFPQAKVWAIITIWKKIILCHPDAGCMREFLHTSEQPQTCSNLISLIFFDLWLSKMKCHHIIFRRNTSFDLISLARWESKAVTELSATMNPSHEM